MSSQLNASFSGSGATDVQLSDLGEMLSLFIQDAGYNDLSNPAAIDEALGEINRLLEDGFKYEADKGLLYNALHNALGNIRQNVKTVLNTDNESISIKTSDLEGFKTGFVQLSEAALQFGGHSNKEILPNELREYFSNNADGHGPDDEKYKATMLRDLVKNTIPAFFDKYPVNELNDEQLDFFASPTPAQTLM